MEFNLHCSLHVQRVLLQHSKKVCLFYFWGKLKLAAGLRYT